MNVSKHWKSNESRIDLAKAEGGSFTWVFDLMKCTAENFKRPAKLLSSKVWMEREEDLDDRGRAVATLLYCTHLV